jgi:multiple sugar transport system substrate-binding protein
MVRSLIFTLLLVCLIYGLSACSKGGGGGGETSSTATVVRLQVFGDPAELEAYKELIAGFERANPDVRIEFIPVGKQKDHMTKLTTSFIGGDAPDLFLINFRRYGQFAEKNVLEPLGPRIFERGKIKESDLYEQPVEAFTYNGTLTCIPQNASSLVVYYNRALFNEAKIPLPKDGWVWNDFFNAAKALTKDTNGDGKTDVYGLGLEPTLIRLAPFIWQNGGDIVDDLYKPTRLNLDKPLAQEVLKSMQLWPSKHKIVPTIAESMSEDHEARFARGGLAMFLQSRGYTASLRQVPNLDWDVAPLPKRRAQSEPVTVLHSDAYCMAKDSKVKDAAYRFIEYALSPEGAGILAKTGRTVPVVKSIANSPVFLDPTQRPASAQVFLDSMAHMRRTPNIGVWNEIETRVDPLLEEWFFAGTEGAQGTPGKLGQRTEEEENVGKTLNNATRDLFSKGTP